MRNFDNSQIDFNNKNILITGGTGSFGKKFVEKVISNFSANRLIVFSRDEQKQFEMAEKFSPNKYSELRYFLGDIRDYDRLLMAMRGIDIVVHAAAIKIVPSAEYNPFECIRTNVMGAENVVKASIFNNVEKVIALSTDKAANPVNLYGASKLASDKIFVAANNYSPEKTIFSVVRYGNVIGSRGSVYPFIKKLLNEGHTKLPITDKRMTRFMITLSQGVNFVFKCLQKMEGGEIFIPKIPSMKIIDLMHAIAPQCDTHVIGIRPGEKLHEVMITEDDARYTLELDDHYVITPVLNFWNSKLKVKGEKVSEKFTYKSDTNTEWISVQTFKDIINNIENFNDL